MEAFLGHLWMAMFVSLFAVFVKDAFVRERWVLYDDETGKPVTSKDAEVD
jgi:hypothetical protein